MSESPVQTGSTAQAVLPSALVQIAYRVTDLEAACREWATKAGAGPFLVRRNMNVTATHQGEPAVYDHSTAFGQWGPLMLELVELHACEPASMRDVIAHEQIGQVNHFACFVDDLEASSAALISQGCPLTMVVTTSSGMPVHYHDARSVVGAVLELYVGTDHLRALYTKVADLAVDWDGTDPVRYL
jgi:hypothetical protein